MLNWIWLGLILVAVVYAAFNGSMAAVQDAAFASAKDAVRLVIDLTGFMIFMLGREDDYVRRLRIVNDLRGAFHREEVQVWYQPKVNLPDGVLVGAEALVRWQHPEYGWLAPDEFVPAAEEAGTIVHLTRYVLKQAIAECRRWKTSGYSLQVSVNISARDLCDDYLPYYVLQLLKEQNVEPQHLTILVRQPVERRAHRLDQLSVFGGAVASPNYS